MPTTFSKYQIYITMVGYTTAVTIEMHTLHVFTHYKAHGHNLIYTANSNNHIHYPKVTRNVNIRECNASYGKLSISVHAVLQYEMWFILVLRTIVSKTKTCPRRLS